MSNADVQRITLEIHAALGRKKGIFGVAVTDDGKIGLFTGHHRYARTPAGAIVSLVLTPEQVRELIANLQETLDKVNPGWR